MTSLDNSQNAQGEDELVDEIWTAYTKLKGTQSYPYFRSLIEPLISKQREQVEKDWKAIVDANEELAKVQVRRAGEQARQELLDELESFATEPGTELWHVIHCISRKKSLASKRSDKQAGDA